MKENLYIGIIIDGDELPAWVVHMIKSLENLKFCHIKSIIKNNIIGLNKSEAFSGNYLYYKYRKYDSKKFKLQPDALKQINIDDVIAVKKLNITSHFEGMHYEITQGDFNLIERLGLDLIINCCTFLPRGDFKKLALYGIWYHHIGKNYKVPSNLYGFWEVINNSDEIMSSLCVLKNKDETKIAYKSYSVTDNLSVNRSLNEIYWKLATFLPRALNDLVNSGEEKYFSSLSEKNSIRINEKNDFEIPGNLEMIKLWIKFNYKRWRKIFLRTLIFDIQWMLYFRISDEIGISKDLNNFKVMLPPKDRFWADPFVVYRNNKYYIFIEELLYGEDKGFISVIEMDRNGNYSQPVKLIEEDYHLSFPFLLEESGTLYMIPESKGNSNIQLYKCENFPYQWKLEKIIMKNVKAVDTVVFVHNGKYWLFTNSIINEGASFYDELFLYYSDSLFSDEWMSHPKNPIISDVKKARSAGELFELDGNIYRPSQNCSKNYGYGIQINRIKELNEKNYEEELVESIFPDWDNKLMGSHTINFAQNITVIDGWRKRNKFFN